METASFFVALSKPWHKKDIVDSATFPMGIGKGTPNQSNRMAFTGEILVMI